MVVTARANGTTTRISSLRRTPAERIFTGGDRYVAAGAKSQTDATPNSSDDIPEFSIPEFSIAELIAQHPDLHPPVVDGLFRQGETANIVSATKVGKSWLGYGLALSIMTGRPWLARYPTTKGRVLLIDNELHPPTLASRLKEVSAAMGISLEDVANDLMIWTLRGRLRSLQEMRQKFLSLGRGDYAAIILDAKYRFQDEGTNENDNAAETRLYNLLDEYAEHTGAAFVIVHHSTKGSQSEKRVTDVGAGAGAQSRAVDCHVVIREHEEEGAYVIEGAVRSFPPPAPLSVRWQWPLWMPSQETDPRKLKGRLSRGDQRQNDKDKEAFEIVERALRPGLANATAGWVAKHTGYGKGKAERLLGLLVRKGRVVAEPGTVVGNNATVYRLKTEGVD